MTDTEPTPDLQDVLADLRRHLAWQEESAPLILIDRASVSSRPAAAQPAAPVRAPAVAKPEPARPLARPAERPLSEPVYRTERLYQMSTPPSEAPGREAPPPTPPVAAKEAEPVFAEPKTLDEIRRELGDCRRCKLCDGRKNIVFGVGNPKAKLVFVGEGPGAQEDAQGIPFVGEAGQLLTKMIEAMGFGRDEVYICNVVKCRPPGNRNPEPDEIAACEPFLRAQLASIKPQVIVALGKFAAQTLLRDTTAITRLRGSWREYHGVPLMPTFHPAYLLRNPAEKKNAWTDLQQVMKVFGKEPKRG